MTEMEQRSLSLEHQCQTAVALFMTRHPSQLLTNTAFVQQTLAHMLQGNADDPYKAATGIYSLTLYSACSGTEGTDRQALGYQELYTYLHTVAVWRFSDVCDDATQSALLQVYERFAVCRHPIAFLAFAFRQLTNAVRSLRRQNNRQGELFDEAFHTNPPVDPNQADPLDLSIDDEQRVQIQHDIAAFRRAHPRASNQLNTLVLKYLQGMDDEDIGKSLGVPVKRVYEMRALARKRLRTDARWRALAVAFGVLSEEA